MVQTMMRAPPGSFSGGRSTMAEYSAALARNHGTGHGRALFWLIIAGDHAALVRRGASPSSAITASVVMTKPKAVRMQASPACMQLGPVHAVDAVFDHDHRIVAHIGGGRGGEHAGVGVHAGDQKRVDAVRAQQEIEVGAKEAVVALLGVDDEVALSSSSCGMTVQPGPPMMLCRITFLRVASGSSARVRQNGLARISSASR